MRIIAPLILACLFLSARAYPAACCVGGGAQNFVQLQELQEYRVGVASAYRSVSGLYGPSGTLTPIEGRELWTLSAGLGYRINTESEASLIVPVVRLDETENGKKQTQTSLGDLQVGYKLRLVDNYLHSQPYPRIDLITALKIPTAPTEPMLVGNGLWEGTLGISATKRFFDLLVSLSSSYTYRVSKTTLDYAGVPVRLKEGDRIEIAASTTWSPTQRWSVGAGLLGQWDGKTQINRSDQNETNAQLLQAQLSTSYFLTRYWLASVSVQHPLGDGKNQQQADLLSLALTYSLY